MPKAKDLKIAASNGAASLGQEGQTSEQALTQINREFQEKAVSERAKELKLPYIDVGMFPINPDVLRLVSEDQARIASLIPFFKMGAKVRVAVVDPEKQETKIAISALESQGYSVQINLASAVSLESAFRHYASEQYKLPEEIKNVVQEEEIHYEKELKNLAELKTQLSGLPAEEGLNMLHVSAIKAGASDIHYQPEEKSCTVRFRIDSVLHTVFEIDHELYLRLINQLKYKAKMKLNITSVPQDGRFRFLVNERKIDVRVASLPTEYGEAFVCRILDSGRHFGSFAELGFEGRSLKVLNNASSITQGMVLVTGPTSSGKTTTLYVLLNAFNTPESKIITLEDPIEYHLRGITQSQIDEKRGYTFSTGLRSILRQDPDVVMIGEIRDLETAETSAQAALTGHVVLSTLHTNSAVDTIPRLMTIGVPGFLIAPAVSVIVAQRLVRRLCVACRKQRVPTKEEKQLFEKTLLAVKAVDPESAGQMPEKISAAGGCEVCNGTGYRGQMVVSEVLEIDDELEEAILKNTSAPALFALARKKGMITLAEDAFLKIMKGETTLEEVHRVIHQA